MCVAELLDPNGGGWNRGRLAEVLLPFEVEQVLSIRLSLNRPKDDWYWGFEHDGFYTVRSAYRMMLGVACDMAEGSSWEREKSLWNKLWKAPEGLDLAVEVGRDSLDIKEWIEAVWSDLGVMEYGKVMVGCWAIWEHRNKVIFDGLPVDPRVIVRRASDVLAEGAGGDVCVGKVKRRGRRGVDEGGGQEGWKPAKRGFVKINVDAGVKEGEEVRTGVVCWDEGGQVLWGLLHNHGVFWEVHVAEAVAVMDGLEEARRRGHQQVEVESDCLQVVEALRRKEIGRSMFSLIIDDILSFCSNFISVSWSHTCRTSNSVAHSLAHLVPRVLGRSVWEGLLPPNANSAVIFDLSLL
ncbi:uncharacterized protein LOC141631361 [Silene latifolia]|uniref:uncharacterized protein LOC141631361 n=1 Tax=Silene latifolia TaxID=37657 RepID=UPI003D773B58